VFAGGGSCLFFLLLLPPSVPDPSRVSLLRDRKPTLAASYIGTRRPSSSTEPPIAQSVLPPRLMYARALVMVDSDPLSPSPPLPTDASMTSPPSINLDSHMEAKKAPAPPRKCVFSKEEVATHNSEESCWLIVGNDVYDVTAFLALHPAGAKPLLRRAGGDATRDFSFHSRTAQKSWRQYKIGVLEGSESFCLLM